MSVPYVKDSKTSREAAESMEPHMARLEKYVYEMIRKSGQRGCTDDEIEVSTGLSHQSASARRRDLVIRRLVVPDGDHVRPTRSGRRAQVWRIAQ